MLIYRRFSPRIVGWFLVGWLSIVSTLSLFYNGPMAGNGIAWASTAMLGVFLVGPRAGVAVVAAFCGAFALQLAATRSGWVPPPRDLALTAGAWVLPRIGVAGLVPLIMCILGFALLTRSLAEAVTGLITERQRSEASREAQRLAEDRMKANQHFEAIGKLASGVAHDVNNALTTVQCSAEMLQLTLPPGDEQRLAQDILTASRSAAQTARQLLAMNRRSYCQPTNICPAREAETVSRLVARLLPPNIQLTLEVKTNRRILVDAGDLQQALLNLLLNARDAMPHGGRITLSVEEHESAAPGRRVAVHVKDTGTGISPEVLPQIFAPFFTTKGQGRGTGLGLAMVANFVEEAGGTIDVQTALGQGTTLSLYFPECPVPPAIQTTLEVPLPASGGLRVLLVEDDPDLRGVLERVLIRGGYTVSACGSAHEALQLMEKSAAFDILCADGLLDSVSFPLLSTFRIGRPHAPILLCTGHVAQDQIRTDLAGGKFELLRKPFTGTEFLARVRAMGQPAAT